MAVSAVGLAALLVAASSILTGAADPTIHAFDATLWVLAAYVLFHATLALVIAVFVLARARSGFVSLQGELRIARLWADYAAATGALALGAAWLPGMLS